MQILAGCGGGDRLYSRQGVLHGDLKLANILMADVPKLMDFGLASISEGFTVERLAVRHSIWPPNWKPVKRCPEPLTCMLLEFVRMHC